MSAEYKPIEDVFERQSPVEDPAPAEAAPAAEETTPQDAATLAAELEAVRAELARAQDNFLRKAAEHQNYRRRTEAERQTLVEDGKAVVLGPMLDLFDDFERSLQASERLAAEGEAFGQLRAGLELMHQKFQDALARVGVAPIEALGKPFHESEHEAVMQQEAPEGVAPGTVVAELQRGYRLGGRVLRYSKVAVAA